MSPENNQYYKYIHKKTWLWNQLITSASLKYIIENMMLPVYMSRNNMTFHGYEKVLKRKG